MEHTPDLSREYVIHNPVRMDRVQCVASLRLMYPRLAWQPAITVPWEKESHNAAVRGCSIAHLEAVTAGPPSDVLVFEDDAVAIPEYLDLWNRTLSKHIPSDAGIVILGGETEAYGPSDQWGFRTVLPPFWGSHAVLYRRGLFNTSFLVNAYKVMATQKLGHPVGICYESVIIQAAVAAGVRIVRPSHIPFTTLESQSDRDGAVAPARTRWQHLPMERPVAPSMCLKVKDGLWVALNTRCASTSFKKLITGEVEEPHKEAGWSEIPGTLEKDPKDCDLFMVLRDPVDRFLSTVRWFNGKSHPHFPDMGLDIDVWLDRIQFEHETCTPAQQDEHIRSQSAHTAIRKITKVVRLDNLSNFAKAHGFELEQAAASDKSVTIPDLTPDQLARVKTLYADDYKMISMLESDLNLYNDHVYS